MPRSLSATLVDLRARFSPGTVELAMRGRDGEYRRPEPVLLYRGLAVHAVNPLDDRSPWQITHAPSGRLLPHCHLSTERKALLLALRLARLTDWERAGTDCLMTDLALARRMCLAVARVGALESVLG